MASTAPPDSAQELHSEALDRALAYAANGFRRKARKGSRIPYLTHLMAVTALVGEYGGTEEQMIVAVLHDALEDLEGVTQAGLAREFGPKIAGMVRALSDTTQEERNGAEKPAWRLRKDRYLAHLATADGEVRLVCAADKLHNALSLLRDLRLQGDGVWNRFNAGPEDQAWYYGTVLATLRQGWDHPILVELEAAVTAVVQAAKAVKAVRAVRAR